MKLAFVIDFLIHDGEKERVLREMHRLYPESPIYTLFYDRKFTKTRLPKAEIRASYLQHNRLARYFTSLWPAAIESLELSKFDVVISVAGLYSKGLILRPKTRHLCYSFDSLPKNHLLRFWDRQISDRVDQFIAPSKAVQDKINKYYRRNTVIIHPPVTTSAHNTYQPDPLMRDLYLMDFDFDNFQDVNYVIETFNKLDYPLVIIGKKDSRKGLDKMGGKIIYLSAEELGDNKAAYYEYCRAFIAPKEETFSVTSIQAMQAGKPVLALGQGASREIVVEGITGEFFDDPIPAALADGLLRLNQEYNKYDPIVIKQHASKYSIATFEQQIRWILSPSSQSTTTAPI